MFDQRDIDLAWLAGLFDGEGCISFGTGKKQPHTIRLRIVLKSRDKFVIERVLSIAGYGRLHHRVPTDAWRPGASDQWEWDGHRAADNHKLLNDLLPHLFLKNADARKAINWIETYSKRAVL